MKFFSSPIKLFEFNSSVLSKSCDYGTKAGKRKSSMGRNKKKKKKVMPSSCNALLYLTTEESFCHCDCKY